MVEQEARVQCAPSPLVGADDAVASLQIVCAWCQQHSRWQRVQTPMPFHTSYSICPACLVPVASVLRVMPSATPQTADEPCAVGRDGPAFERRRAPMSADMPASPVPEARQPASGEAFLQRVCDTRLQAHVIQAGASAARQHAKEVRAYARHFSTVACAACVVHRYLIRQLHRHERLHPTPKRGGHSTAQTRGDETCTRARVPREPKGQP